MTTIDVAAIALPESPAAIDLSNEAAMSEGEARMAVLQINTGATFIRGKLLEIHRRKGWKALGYESWKEFGEVEFGTHRDTLYKMVEAAEAEAVLITAGAEPSKIFNTPDSQLRVIQQVQGSEMQLQAFNTLQSWKQESGSVTAKDAEAAVWAVDTTKRYNKAEKLVAAYISSNRDAEVSDPEPILEWAKEKKGLSPRQAQVLKDDVAEFVGDRPTSSSSTPTKPNAAAKGSSSPPKPAPITPTPDKSLEIASVLNGYEPEDLTKAITRFMEEEFRVKLLLGVLYSIAATEIAKIVKASDVSNEEAKKLSDLTYSLTAALDEEFGIVIEE